MCVTQVHPHRTRAPAAQQLRASRLVSVALKSIDRYHMCRLSLTRALLKPNSVAIALRLSKWPPQNRRIGRQTSTTLKTRT